MQPMLLHTDTAERMKRRRCSSRRWTRSGAMVRVLQSGEKAADVTKDASTLLLERGWDVDTAEGDADDWGDDDRDDRT